MVLDIILDPDHFLGRRADDPTFVGPAVIVALSGIAAAASSFVLVQSMAGAFGDDAGSVMAIGGAIGAIVTFVSAFVIWIVVAGLMHVVSLYFDGEGDFKTLLALVGWGHLPAIFSGIVSAVATYLTLQNMTFPTDPVAMQAFNQQLYDQSAVVMASVLGVVFTLWQGFIWTFGVKHARKLDVREAALTVALPVAGLIAVTIWSLL